MLEIGSVYVFAQPYAGLHFELKGDGTFWIDSYDPMLIVDFYDESKIHNDSLFFIVTILINNKIVIIKIINYWLKSFKKIF